MQIKSGAALPEPHLIEGRLIDLLPLTMDHMEDLYRLSHGPESHQLYAYMTAGPFDTLQDYRAFMSKLTAGKDPQFFCIRDKRSGQAVGQAALMRIDPVNRVIEVGHILYSPLLKRHAGATEAMYLLARYIFDELNYRRYEWKCDAQNLPSIAAAARLGFSYEGTFRQHMIVREKNRDTAWFSLLDFEWPERRQTIEKWLSPENFDEKGQQKTALKRRKGVKFLINNNKNIL